MLDSALYQCFNHFRRCKCLNTSLALCLILLQFVIPFLHAHNGIDQSPPGLHIPGLEQLLANDSTQASNSVVVDTHLDLIIGVGSALETVDNDGLSLDAIYQLLLLLGICVSFVLPLIRLEQCKLRFLTLQSCFYNLLQISICTPRAPPYFS